MSEQPRRTAGHRFLVTADALRGSSVSITGLQARQISRVLRLRPGEAIRVFHGTAVEYEVTLERVAPDEVSGVVTGQCRPGTEPACRVWLAVPLLKSDKLEWVIQKGVELGVCGFLLTRTHRTVVSDASSRYPARLERYRRIAIEATEQSGRLHPPAIEGPLDWRAAFARARTAEIALIADARAPRSLPEVLASSPHAASAILYTGPEGGFTSEELEEAGEARLVPVAFGPRVLRAETAALAGLAVLMALLEEH